MSEGIEHGHLIARPHGNDPKQLTYRVRTHDGKELKGSPKHIERSALTAAESSGEGGVAVRFQVKQGRFNTVCLVDGPELQRKAPPEQERDHAGSNGNPKNKARFVNPYGFVPKPARTGGGPLADADTPSRGVLHGDRYTGSLTVRLTTETPLVLLDASRAEPVEGKADHLSIGVVSRDGQAEIPGSSLKGALRSAFEMATASRFSVFPRDSHDLPLAQRMRPNVGLQMLPAVVSEDGGHIEVLLGSTAAGQQANRNNHDPLHAAWWPRYYHQGTNIDPPGPSGTKVIRRIRRTADRRGRYNYWRVVNDGEPLRAGDSEEEIEVEGVYCETGKNIGTKHDERLFFAAGEQFRIRLPLTDALRRSWDAVITSYREAHTATEVSSLDGPPALRGARWSKHITERSWPAKGKRDRPNLDLEPGTALYVHAPRVRGNLTAADLKGLYPVMIARQPFEASPWELAEDDDITPAVAAEQQSVADRLFGWVSQSGADQVAARASRLRISNVEVTSSPKDSVKKLPNGGLPLTILSQPKPTRPGFYTRGRATNGGGVRGGNYAEGDHLGGAKAYLHQSGGRGTDNNWTSGEHRRAADTQDSQNRTLRDWVPIGTEFTVRLDVLDVSAVEIGALLWTLEQGRLRIGGGKPIGFGSMNVEVIGGSSFLPTGDQWKSAWTLNGSSHLEQFPEIAHECIAAYKRALVTLVGEPEATTVCAAYSHSLNPPGTGKGGVAVHYPRPDPQPDPEGKNFEWFTQQRDTPLPPLESHDLSLPFESEQAPNRGHHRPERRRR